jgi:hypothetical protein
MAYVNLAEMLVFASVGPFISSMWLGGDFGLVSLIYLSANYLVRLPVFGQDTNLGWVVFNDLDAFWYYTMIGFVSVGSSVLGMGARLLLKIPNIIHIRKIFWTNGDRNQSKFLVPNNGTVVLMLFLGILTIAGTQIFHDIFIPQNEVPLLAVIATPLIIAALYFIVYFIMVGAFNNEQGTALWGYETTSDETVERGEEIPLPNWSVLRRTFLLIAAHHILITVAIDLTIIFSEDFITTFIVTVSVVGGFFVVDIILYIFWTRTLSDFHPYYDDWVADMVDSALSGDGVNLVRVPNNNANDLFNKRAAPMSAPTTHVSRPTFVSGRPPLT